MIIILKAIHYFLDFDSLDFIPFHLLTSVLHFADRFPSSQLLKVALKDTQIYKSQSWVTKIPSILPSSLSRLSDMKRWLRT
ncbi:hypothetical protein EYC84_006750 [Monilinia fructicola]|uniref:Uncharacterized protein n=1 Tax=Monilinia fructicola TaxID=38448 RepID=A0A5M9K836_MONFR|nr:hypothetical protein EYC84_006750 [Monilinia fructicola]